MSSSKNRRDALHTDHFVSGKDKRAERRTTDILRRPHDVNEDIWDDYELGPREHRFRKNQKLE